MSVAPGIQVLFTTHRNLLDPVISTCGTLELKESDKSAYGRRATFVETTYGAAGFIASHLKDLLEIFIESTQDFHSIELVPRKWGQANPVFVRKMTHLPKGLRVIEETTTDGKGSSSPCLVRKHACDKGQIEYWYRFTIPQLMLRDPDYPTSSIVQPGIRNIETQEVSWDSGPVELDGNSMVCYRVKNLAEAMLPVKKIEDAKVQKDAERVVHWFMDKDVSHTTCAMTWWKGDIFRMLLLSKI